MKTRTWRSRVGLAVPVAIAALAITACSSPPSGPSEPEGPTPTPWFAAGCIDSTMDDVPDFQFTGVADEVGNVWGFDQGDDVWSEDGTCTGTPAGHATVVRAADEAAAIAACEALEVPFVMTPRLVDHGYAAPVDAFLCFTLPAE